MEHLFIYGEVYRVKEHPVNHLLRAYGREVEKATCPGEVKTISAGEALLENGPGSITGMIFEIDNPEEAFRILDLSMGYDPARELMSQYIRKTAIVKTESGKELIVWVYFYNGRISQK